ncbi:hypothetical protein [Methylobacillus sp. MM3]|jgi:hypothetical protein|uniref:hypothetical protein n=1 Tax=Methylobacillus sp. MM3 TaxID=1848039 RepID=UPI001042683F|nr:hypothetical protein [Methylobacillus sp. MM3]
MRIWLSIVGLLLLAGCDGPFSHEETEAKNQLLLLAPLGSDARQAKPILEEKGFKCHWVPNSTFSGIKGRHDFLYCDLEKLVGVLVSRRWQLALIHKDFVVTNAKFGISLTGL